MQKVFIGIGSNLGDKQKTCRRAVAAVGGIPGTRLIDCSHWYLTRPMGVADQDWYVNGAALIETTLGPRAVLDHLLRIEKQMGRTRKTRWEPRIIDLDILFYGAELIAEKDLDIPHPLVHLRRFALQPLSDLAPDFIHPVLGVSIRDLLEGLPIDGQETLLMQEEQ